MLWTQSQIAHGFFWTQIGRKAVTHSYDNHSCIMFYIETHTHSVWFKTFIQHV